MPTTRNRDQLLADFGATKHRGPQSACMIVNVWCPACGSNLTPAEDSVEVQGLNLVATCDDCGETFPVPYRAVEKLLLILMPWFLAQSR